MMIYDEPKITESDQKLTNSGGFAKPSSRVYQNVFAIL